METSKPDTRYPIPKIRYPKSEVSIKLSRVVSKVGKDDLRRDFSESSLVISEGVHECVRTRESVSVYIRECVGEYSRECV